MDASLQASVVTLSSWPTCCVNVKIRLHSNSLSLFAFVHTLAHTPLLPRCRRPLRMTDIGKHQTEGRARTLMRLGLRKN